MTVNPDEGHTGLDRDTNQRPDVNEEAKQASADDAPVAGGDALQGRMDELTDAAKDADGR